MHGQIYSISTNIVKQRISNAQCYCLKFFKFYPGIMDLPYEMVDMKKPKSPNKYLSLILRYQIRILKNIKGTSDMSPAFQYST